MHYSTPGVYWERIDGNPQQIDLRRTDVAGFVGIAERGPLHRPIKIESPRQFSTMFGERMAGAYLAYAVAGFFDNGGGTCWVVRVADPTQAVAARVRLFIPGRAPLVLEATSPGAWGNAVVVEPVWGRDRITHLVVRAPDGRTQSVDLAAVDELRGPAGGDPFDTADPEVPAPPEDGIVQVGPDSYWIAAQEIGARAEIVKLAGGADGLASLTPDHFAGHPDREGTWGVAALERVDGVSFVAVPDLMAGQELTGRASEIGGFDQRAIHDAQIRIIGSCIRRRDRVAILDLPPRMNRAHAIAHGNGLTHSSFAAVYQPWVIVDDPLAIQGPVRSIPPSGHVAGMYARTDRRRGVHKPPANEVLEGVYDATELLDDRGHGDLNDHGINAIRAIPGRGVLVLGARTLDSDPRWRYVNVRRLFATIEEALDEQMQWVTFEPNSPRLWGEVDRAVRGFLERLFRSGMLDGETSEDAYFVRCDASTNPSSETDAGRVTCLIGIQPPYPAEFVIVRVGVTPSGIEVQEQGAQDV